MSKKQTDQIAARNYTREQAEAAMRDLCLTSCTIDEINANMNAQLALIRGNFEAELTALQETAELLEAKIQSWADKNPGEFEKRKSIEMIHGICGYRTSPPSVRLIRGVTWEKSIALIEGRYPDLIRTKKEADKEGLLAGREVLTEADYKAIGLRIDQDEKFYVEVRKESVAQT